jgi:Tfp pilus assembly protein PilF
MLAACGGTPGAVRPEIASAKGWASQQEVKQAIQLLNQGNASEARAALMKALKKQPGDAIARKLIEQIDTPAEQLLGSKSFNRTAAEGDSFSQLAERYLGDPMMAYALARYNDISVPESLKAGQKLRIPGEEPAARPPRTALEKPQSPNKPNAAEVTKPKVTPGKSVNSAHASNLRARGLEQLNRGAINSAVALLAQASHLDPQNPLIARDLTRARRIQKTVKQP